MIAVYAIATVKADKVAEFETIAKALVQASQKDAGCICYGCGRVQGTDNVYTFVENWQSMTDLDSHTKQPHFVDGVAKMADLLEKPLEINVVDLL